MTTAPSEADFTESPVHPDELLWERRYRAASLRNAGATIAQIADKCGVSTMTVRKDIALVLAEAVADSIEEMVARQRTVLADMQRAAYPKALKGNPDSIGAVLRVLEHEAKLFGLYAPGRVDIGISDKEFASQVAELIAVLRPDTVKELMRGHIPDPRVLDVELVEPVGPAGGNGGPRRGEGGPGRTPAARPADATPFDPAPADLRDPHGEGEPWSNLGT